MMSLMYLPSNQFLFVFHFFSNIFLGTSRSSTPAIFASDPATCPIIPGCETTIEISKGRTGLGLSIVGGSDTLLVRTHPEMLQTQAALSLSPERSLLERLLSLLLSEI